MSKTTPKEFSPIFVVGHPRSGTTMLTAILGRHEELTSLPETHYFNKLSPIIDDRLRRDSSGLLSWVRRLPRMGGSGIDWENVAHRLTDEGTTSSHAIFRAMLQSCADSAGASSVVEQTPVHIRHLSEILDAYPGARAVWILRDGRACVASLKTVDWASNDNDTLARRWVANMAYALHHERRYAGRIHRIRYEDLLASPAAELGRLHAFLGLDFEEQQLEPRDESAILAQSARPWHGNVSRRLIPGRAGAWADALSDEEKEHLSALMGEWLRALGYDTVSARTPRNRMRAARSRVLRRLLGQPVVLDSALRLHRQRLVWQYRRTGAVPQ